MNFKELERKVFDCGMAFASKKAKVQSFEEDYQCFKQWLDTFCEYSNWCVKIAETKAFEIQTLKSAKSLIGAFRVGMATVNAQSEQLSEWIKEGNDISVVMKNVFKIKEQFEKIMSCVENYAFKKEQRVYLIPQDKRINNAIVNTVHIYGLIAKLLKDTHYASFRNEAERYAKRYEHLKTIKTYDLDDSEVVSR